MVVSVSWFYGITRGETSYYRQNGNVVSEVLIECSNVSKRFCKDLRKSLWYGVKDVFKDLLVGKRHFPRHSSEIGLRQNEFWANKDVSFELNRGECLGLIGRNGAGKTTLLKLLNGLIKPDSGSIRLNGSVAALIALGAGFNPILSGRENVIVNGSVLGLSLRQIKNKLDEIVEFAELNEFIDSPVRTYSSGMQVRLGFTVAALLIKPDILLLDEVLAVGDAEFRAKCYQVVGKTIEHSAVIFVSHNIDSLRTTCTRGILLRNGAIDTDSDIISACRQYSLANGETSISSFKRVESPFQFFNLSCQAIESDGNLALQLTVNCSLAIPLSGKIRLQIYDDGGQFCLESPFDRPLKVEFSPEKKSYEFQTEELPFRYGKYFLSLLVIEDGSINPVVWSYLEVGFQSSHQVETKSPVVLSIRQTD